MAWPVVELGEFCDAKLGKALNGKAPSGSQTWPYLRNINVRWGSFDLADVKQMHFTERERAALRVEYGDLLICEGGEVGRCAIWRKQCGEYYFQNAIHRVRPDPARCITDFLYYQMRFKAQTGGLREFTTQATIAHLSGEKLAKLPIVLPPLAEQQRIVDILDRAAAIQRLRRATEEKAHEIIPALFVDMFGDPATNPKGWDEKTVNELCTLVRGSSPRPQGDARFFNGPVPRLMIADITRDGVYVTPRIDSLTELGATKSRPMTKGSVVMAVSGAVGLPAILSVDCCIHDGFVGFRNLSDRITARYFYWHLVARRQRSDGEAVGAIFRNITTDQIRAWKVPVPPPALQGKFEAIMDAADAATKASSAASDVAVKAAASLGQSLLG